MILIWIQTAYKQLVHLLQKNKTYKKILKFTMHCYNGAQKYRKFPLVCATQPTHYSNEIIQTNKLNQNQRLQVAI